MIGKILRKVFERMETGREIHLQRKHVLERQYREVETMKQIFASISRTGQPNHPPVPVDTMRHIAGKFEPVSESSLLNLPCNLSITRKMRFYKKMILLNQIENVINGEAQSGDVVTISETGEIVINGEGTGYFATKGEAEKVNLPYVNEEGILVLIDAEGKEVVTGIRVAPVTAVVNEDGSAVLTIIAADGTKQEVNIPSASSAISEIEFLDENYQTVKTLSEIKLYYWDAVATTKWKGVRGNIPNNSTTYSTNFEESTLYTRISPASVDASSIDFKLVDTKDNVASINLKATMYSGTLTRTANGLYETKVVPGTFADGGDPSKLANEFKATATNYKAMALKPGSANYKSLFNVKVTPIPKTDIDLGTISLYKGASNILNSVPINNGVNDATPSSCSVKVGESVTASVSKYYNLYDLYLAVSEEDKELFGIEFSEDGRSFKATKSPDNVTDATIDLMVYTLPNKGSDDNIKCATIRIEINRTLGEATGRTKLYKEDIWAKTYNNDVKYDIFRKSAGKWYRDDIKDVIFTSGNPNVFEVTIGTPKDPTGSVAEGNFVDSYIEVEGVTENTAKLNVAIEDIWGYTLKDQVDIKTTLNLGK